MKNLKERIKLHEGYRNTVYKDTLGFRTIGYGHKVTHTDDFVVPYDTSYTKISCDSSGSFFDIRTDGLQPNRYFRLLIKTERNGLIDIYDDGFFFKIKKN